MRKIISMNTLAGMWPSKDHSCRWNIESTNYNQAHIATTMWMRYAAK